MVQRFVMCKSNFGLVVNAGADNLKVMTRWGYLIRQADPTFRYHLPEAGPSSVIPLFKVSRNIGVVLKT